jgi:hypothetical protein
LLDQHPAFYALAELALELDVAEAVAEETVAALARCGLVNRWEGSSPPRGRRCASKS